MHQESSLSAVPPIALVTGATAGIGATFARHLARWGYDLVLVARDETRLVAIREELERTAGVTVRTIAADLATDAGVDTVAEFLEQAPGVDVLVNNAGFGTKGYFADADAAQQEQMLRVHVLAMSRLTRSALGGMLARRRGSIITVSSVASYLTSAANVNYCATKAYQRVAMESLSQEVRGSGVYVQALCPGFTRTEFHARAHVSTRHIPNWLWMSADEVVGESLDAMRRGGATVVVPGWRNRLLVFVLRYAPWAIPARRRRARTSAYR